VVEDGVGSLKRELKKIPLPEEYKLGLESRGEFLNHSGKMKNNFGMNKRALFPGGGGKSSTTGTGPQHSPNRVVLHARMRKGNQTTREGMRNPL
jgi:hypothetical protein